MDKHFIILGIVVLLIAVGLSGCNEQQTTDGNEASIEKKIIGSWENTYWSEILKETVTQTWTFYEGGNLRLSESMNDWYYWIDENGILWKESDLSHTDPDYTSQTGYSITFNGNDVMMLTVIAYNDDDWGYLEVSDKESETFYRVS
jgi:hypothetical protein